MLDVYFKLAKAFHLAKNSKFLFEPLRFIKELGLFKRNKFLKPALKFACKFLIFLNFLISLNGLNFIFYLLITLYLGTNDFITTHAIRYATAQMEKMIMYPLSIPSETTAPDFSNCLKKSSGKRSLIY